MFKSLISRQLSIVLLTTLSSLLPFNAISANTFDETIVDQDDFIAVAQPYGDNKYNLIVIEQIPDKNPCWSENAGTDKPVNVDLLLLQFDFSGHCRRSTDANGYSIRYDGQDYGLDFLLTLTEKDGQLVLMGNNRRNPGQPPIIVGTSDGINGQPMKIKLNPGWSFTKRTYQGKVLGHVYFSYNSTNAPQILPSSDDEEVNSEGNIREIVAPGVQPQKQFKKYQKTHPITNNIEPTLIKQEFQN